MLLFSPLCSPYSRLPGQAVELTVPTRFPLGPLKHMLIRISVHNPTTWLLWTSLHRIHSPHLAPCSTGSHELYLTILWGTLSFNSLCHLPGSPFTDAHLSQLCHAQLLQPTVFLPVLSLSHHISPPTFNAI